MEKLLQILMSAAVIGYIVNTIHFVFILTEDYVIGVTGQSFLRRAYILGCVFIIGFVFRVLLLNK